MGQSGKEIIKEFLEQAGITVMIDDTSAAEVSCSNGIFMIDVRNPMLIMNMGLDLDFLRKRKKGKSIFRKAIKEMGFRIKLRYKLFEIDL